MQIGKWDKNQQAPKKYESYLRGDAERLRSTHHNTNEGISEEEWCSIPTVEFQGLVESKP